MLAGKLTWQVITPLDRLAVETEARAQLRSTGFLPRQRESTSTRERTAHRGPRRLGHARRCERLASVMSRDISMRESGKKKPLVLPKNNTAPSSTNLHFAKFSLTSKKTLRFLAVNDAAPSITTAIRGEEFLADDGWTTSGLQRALGPRQDSSRPRQARKASRCADTSRRTGRLSTSRLTGHELVLGATPCCIAVAPRRDGTKAGWRARSARPRKWRLSEIWREGSRTTFNNLLSVILSYSQMLAADLQPGESDAAMTWTKSPRQGNARRV